MRKSAMDFFLIDPAENTRSPASQLFALVLVAI